MPVTRKPLFFTPWSYNHHTILRVLAAHINGCLWNPVSKVDLLTIQLAVAGPEQVNLMWPLVLWAGARQCTQGTAS